MYSPATCPTRRETMLDVAKRDWSDDMLAVSARHVRIAPALFEGSEITGELLPEIARRWAMPVVPVVVWAVEITLLVPLAPVWQT